MKQPGYLPEDVPVIVELDLPGTIKDDIVILPDKLVEFGLEPILVLQEVLHAIQEASIGSELHFLHDFLESDQLLNICVEGGLPTSQR